MKRSNLNRRDFNKLTMAAFGGVLTGTAIGCGQQDGGDGDDGGAGGTDGGDGGQHDMPGSGTQDDGAAQGTEGEGDQTADANPLLSEPHVCRGLNACQGKGRSEENACAGQSACFTAEAHSCAGQNACKGQGGCGEKPGQNACQGMGQCGVPLAKRETWDKARAALKAALPEGKKLGMPEQMGPPMG